MICPDCHSAPSVGFACEVQEDLSTAGSRQKEVGDELEASRDELEASRAEVLSKSEELAKLQKEMEELNQVVTARSEVRSTPELLPLP